MKLSSLALVALLGCDPAVDDGPRLEGTEDAQPTDSLVVSVDDEGVARPDAALDRDAAPDLDAAPDAAIDRDAAPDAFDRDAALDFDADPGCPEGTACNPIPVDILPYQHVGDTRDAPAAEWDAYACAPDTDESGGEVVYVLDLVEETTLIIAVDDRPGDGVDVDVHLLTEADPTTCRARNNTRIEQRVPAGRHFIVVDTWVNAAGDALAGPYTLQVSQRMEIMGDCATREEPIRMAWRACDPSLDCFEAEDDNGQLARFLRLPATGPVVKEAHLVTVEDDFGGGWPESSRDGLEAHYALSQAATGYVMDRAEPWAPEGEGGSMWGQSAYSRPLPVLDEAFYVNMYWSPRPEPGTRMIVTNPENGRAVVASAGFETGPGSNTAIGGVSEEIHHHLGTHHRSTLQLGFAVDQNLPLGPIDCE